MQPIIVYIYINNSLFFSLLIKIIQKNRRLSSISMYFGMKLCRFVGGYVCGALWGEKWGQSGESGYSILTGSKLIKSQAVIL